MLDREKFLDTFSEICQKYPNNLCLCWVPDLEKSFGITFSELNEVSNKLKNFLLKTLDSSYQYISVQLSECFFLPCLLLGIWKSGFSFAGVGTQYTIGDSVKFLDKLAVKFMITDSESNEFNAEIISYFYLQNQKFFLWKRNVSDTRKCFGKWDMCYGIMTSGTTGNLKIIQVPWSSILPNALELSTKFLINEFDCVYQASPYTFDPFYIELFLCLLNGCMLLIVKNAIKINSTCLLKVLFSIDNKNLSSVSQSSVRIVNNNCIDINVKLVNRKLVTILQITPSLLKRWKNEEISEIILSEKSPLKILVCGGEKFPVEILKLKSSTNNTKIYNIYGITEISCWSFLGEVVNFSTNMISIGDALNDIEYKLNDKNELLIGSYKRICLVDDENEFEAGQLVFRNTGDIVDIVSRDLYYVSRSTQIVKKFGIKVNLQNVEEQFMQTNKLLLKSCCCVFDERNMKLGLFYLESNAKAMKCVTFENFLKKGYFYPDGNLKDIEKPDYFIEIPEFPLNEHGKCNKTKLTEYFKKINCTANNSTLDVKDLFDNAWNDVLGLNNSKINQESFAASGGHSILALQLLGKLEDSGLKVPSKFITKLLNGDSKQNCFKCLISDGINNVPKKKIKFSEELLPNNFINIVVNWKSDLDKCIDATPTIFQFKGYELVVVGSHSSKLSLFVLSSGKILWSISLGDRIESSVAVTKDGSTGFVGCYDSFVYCLSMADGNIKWQYKTGDMIKSTPCLSSEEKMVLTASYDRCLYCLSIENGALLKKLKISEKGIFSSGIISTLLKTFYIATLDGTCIAFSEASYKLKWKIKFDNPIFASPCLIQDEKIIFAEVIGTIHCLNPRDGTTLWKYLADGFIYSTPIYQSFEGISLIIFGCNDNNVYCLHLDNEIKLKWRQLTDSSVFARPFVFSTDNEYFIGAVTTKGFLYLCDILSGKILSTIKLNGEVFSSPVASQESIAVGCRDNNIYTLKVFKK